MNNLWPSNLKPSTQKSPSSIVGEQNSYISNHTGGHINLIVREMQQRKTGLWALFDDDFSYKVDLLAPFLNNYSYNLFEFSHPVLLYPVRIQASYEIRKELEISDMVTVDTEEDFIEILRLILQTETVRTAIEKIWGLSKNRV